MASQRRVSRHPVTEEGERGKNVSPQTRESGRLRARVVCAPSPPPFLGSTGHDPVASRDHTGVAVEGVPVLVTVTASPGAWGELKGNLTDKEGQQEGLGEGEGGGGGCKAQLCMASPRYLGTQGVRYGADSKHGTRSLSPKHHGDWGAPECLCTAVRFAQG